MRNGRNGKKKDKPPNGRQTIEAGAAVRTQLEDAIAAELDQLRSARELLGRDAITAALKKQSAGGILNRKETKLLSRYKQIRDDEEVLRLTRKVPQKYYRLWTGRQNKTIVEQADRYGLPCDGETIDIARLVRAFHDFLAANKWKLAAGDSDDPMFADADSPNLERYRAARADQEEIKRDEMRGRMIDHAELWPSLMVLAKLLRDAADDLAREFGQSAADRINEALEKFEEMLSTQCEKETGNANGADDRSDEMRVAAVGGGQQGERRPDRDASKNGGPGGA